MQQLLTWRKAQQKLVQSSDVYNHDHDPLCRSYGRIVNRPVIGFKRTASSWFLPRVKQRGEAESFAFVFAAQLLHLITVYVRKSFPYLISVCTGNSIK